MSLFGDCSYRGGWGVGLEARPTRDLPDENPVHREWVGVCCTLYGTIP